MTPHSDLSNRVDGVPFLGGNGRFCGGGEFYLNKMNLRSPFNVQGELCGSPFAAGGQRA